MKMPRARTASRSRFGEVAERQGFPVREQSSGFVFELCHPPVPTVPALG